MANNNSQGAAKPLNIYTALGKGPRLTLHNETPVVDTGSLFVNILQARGLFFRSVPGRSADPPCWLSLRIQNDIMSACKTAAKGGGSERFIHETFKMPLSSLDNDLFVSIHTEQGVLGSAIVPLHRLRTGRPGVVYIDDWFPANFEVPLESDKLERGGEYPADPFVVAQVRLRISFVPTGQGDEAGFVIGAMGQVLGEVGKLPQRTGRPFIVDLTQLTPARPPSLTPQQTNNNNNNNNTVSITASVGGNVKTSNVSLTTTAKKK